MRRRARVFASLEAGRFVRERGGTLFVWLAPVGGEFMTIKVSTSSPENDVDFEELDAGGFQLLLDRTLPKPRTIEIDLHRWPWRRIRVRGFQHGPAAGHEGDTELVLWDSFGGGSGGGGGNGGGGNGGG